MAVTDETLAVRSGPEGLVGQRLDDYDVESIVGRGAMGIVYRGMHHMIGKRVAIKVMKEDFAGDVDMIARLVREARTVNAIRHPGIVDAFGFGTLENGQPYIVMDLLEGEPLDEWIRREAPVTLKTAGGILEELLSALSAAHKVGVVHRDVKPGNVFLERTHDGHYRVKLLDFGLAGLSDKANGSVRPTNPGSVVGTPAFMAPEQVLGQKMSPLTDLYAVGGIAYMMFTGHLPHEHVNAWEMLNLKLNKPVAPVRKWNTRVEDEVDRWVQWLLEREPSARPGSADEAMRVLSRLRAGRTSGAHPAFGAAARGVIPKRGWQDARTLSDDTERPGDTTALGPVPVVGDTTQPPTAADVSTSSALDSPYAKTHAREALTSAQRTSPEDDTIDPSLQPTPHAGVLHVGDIPRAFSSPDSALKNRKANLIPVVVLLVAVLGVLAFLVLKLAS